MSACILLLRIAYLGAAAAILVFNAVPVLSKTYLPYGARSTPSQKDATNVKPMLAKFDSSQSSGILVSLKRNIDSILLFQVPHDYFKHFYVVSVLSSIFWGFQLQSKGSALRLLALNPHNGELDASSMSAERIVITWFVMLLQGSRRLWEEVTLHKTKSSSTMSFSHWLLGVFFYLGLGIAVWVEGAGNILSQKTDLFSSLSLMLPSPGLLVAFAAYLLAAGFQHDIHVHLTSLRKYSLPSHPAFKYIICPHYTAECVIYTALMVIAAPQHHSINKTIMAFFVFTVINLGATAAGAKDWTAAKFGEASVRGKWRMIPFVW